MIERLGAAISPKIQFPQPSVLIAKATFVARTVLTLLVLGTVGASIGAGLVFVFRKPLFRYSDIVDQFAFPMIGYRWEHAIILGKSTWHDLQTLCALPYHMLLSPRPIQFIQWKDGKLHPLDHDEAWKVSSVARFILISSKNISRFGHLNWGLKFYSLVAIWVAVSALIKRDRVFVTAFATTAILAHLIFSVFIAVWHERSMLKDIATCPNTLIEDLDERKERTYALVSVEAPFKLFNTLPLEIVTIILGHLPTLHTFSSTCKWAAKICYEEEIKLPRLPSALLQSLKQRLLHQMKFMRCTSRLLRDAKPVSETAEHPPGKAFLCIYFHKDMIPLWPPVIKSEYSLAPFITVNSDWLGKHHFFYTVTPVKTLALIFTYHSDYKLSGSSSLYCNKDRHVLILTQISPFHKNEWWLVFQAWSGSTQEYRDAHIQHAQITFQRNLLNNRAIRILFENEGQVVPECKAVWDWFTRFLNEQEVGFFNDQESFCPNEAT
ncbi:MAG TPA: hypothetical protein VFU89_03105, partial [Rhabdochlamydiaceae bacterium]|nr:hypothetical protein [Rhabdochlamydiaceae bacterium]